MGLKLILVYLLVTCVTINYAQLLGSLGIGGSFNVSPMPSSTVDNRTLSILKAILKTPFTKEGFFRKISLLQMLNMGNANGGGFGFNKGFLFGGSGNFVGGGGGAGAAAATTSTTEINEISETTPFPETVFRPSSDDDTEDNNLKINVTGEVVLDASVTGQNVDPDVSVEAEAQSSNTESQNSEIIRNNGNGGRINTSNAIASNAVIRNGSNGRGRTQINGNGSFSINGQGNTSNGFGTRIRANTTSARNGYQYYPAGPDRLTIPTNFQNSNSARN